MSNACQRVGSGEVNNNYTVKNKQISEKPNDCRKEI